MKDNVITLAIKNSDLERENRRLRHLVEELSYALKDAIVVHNKAMETVKEAIKENSLLTETIIHSKLGTIADERRKILEENETLKKEVMLLSGLLLQYEDGR